MKVTVADLLEITREVKERLNTMPIMEQDIKALRKPGAWLSDVIIARAISYTRPSGLVIGPLRDKRDMDEWRMRRRLSKRLINKVINSRIGRAQ